MIQRRFRRRRSSSHVVVRIVCMYQGRTILGLHKSLIHAKTKIAHKIPILYVARSLFVRPESPPHRPPTRKVYHNTMDFCCTSLLSPTHPGEDPAVRRRRQEPSDSSDGERRRLRGRPERGRRAKGNGVRPPPSSRPLANCQTRPAPQAPD